jgi:uncharacterized cupin superfamily protein
MSEHDIVFREADATEMRSCPINPVWVIEGAPVARTCILSTSLDGSATTLLWDCTSGVFNWHYDIDETVYVLDGCAEIHDDAGRKRVIRTGDHVLFRAGSHAVWRVDSYIRKVAFCRSPVPAPVLFVGRLWRKAKKSLGLGRSGQGAPVMFDGA